MSKPEKKTKPSYEATTWAKRIRANPMAEYKGWRDRLRASRKREAENSNPARKKDFDLDLDG